MRDGRAEGGAERGIKERVWKGETGRGGLAQDLGKGQARSDKFGPKTGRFYGNRRNFYREFGVDEEACIWGGRKRGGEGRKEVSAGTVGTSGIAVAGKRRIGGGGKRGGGR